MSAGTGHGVVVAFTGTDNPLGAGPYLARDLNLWDESGEASDLSHLGSEVYREYAGPDLYAIGPFNFNVLFNTELPETLVGQGTPNYPLPMPEGSIVNTLRYSNGMQPILITFPIRRPAVNNTAATFSGNASLLTRNFGSMISNQEQLCPISMQWQTHPQWSHEQVTGP